MKKNLVFKLGLFCAALVLIATCFVSSAWAKYTSNVSATDSARVAKFAVTMQDGSDAVISDTTFKLFDTNFENIKKSGSLNYNNSKKLVAPGSKGGFSLFVESQSEVSVYFDFEVTAETVIEGDSNYRPIKWSVSCGSYTATDMDSLKAALEGLKLFYAANDESKEHYTTVTGEQEVKISWAWQYDDAGNTGVNDSADTALGTADSLQNYSVTIKVTATQEAPKN